MTKNYTCENSISSKYYVTQMNFICKQRHRQREMLEERMHWDAGEKTCNCLNFSWRVIEGWVCNTMHAWRQGAYAGMSERARFPNCFCVWESQVPAASQARWGPCLCVRAVVRVVPIHMQSIAVVICGWSSWNSVEMQKRNQFEQFNALMQSMVE